MNMDSPTAFTGPWTRYTSARPFGSAPFDCAQGRQGKRGGLGTSSAHPTPAEQKTLQSSWQARSASSGQALHSIIPRKGKRESVVGESEWWANVMWRRIAITGLIGTNRLEQGPGAAAPW